MARSFLVFLVFVFFAPLGVVANGGPQNYVDGYIVAMSNSPFVPGAGERVAFLFSFVEADTYKPVAKPIEASLDIFDQFDNLILEDRKFLTDNGFVEFTYTFPKDGKYDLHLSFTVEGERTRETELLLGIKSQESALAMSRLFIASGLAFLVGILLGFGVSKLRS